MMECLAHPSSRLIGILFAVAALFLLVSAWMIVLADPNIGAYAFPPVLIGLILLFIAAALLALRALNRIQDPPQP
jgi:xanthine/uracil permease